MSPASIRRATGPWTGRRPGTRFVVHRSALSYSGGRIKISTEILLYLGRKPVIGCWRAFQYSAPGPGAGDCDSRGGIPKGTRHWKPGPLWPVLLGTFLAGARKVPPSFLSLEKEKYRLRFFRRKESIIRAGPGNVQYAGK